VVRAARASLVLVLALAGGAEPRAHAFLDHAEPRVGSAVAAPREVRLWFTQGLVVLFCRVSVIGPTGFGGAGPVHAIPGDPQGVVVDLKPPVPAADYVVRWRVLSVDTHETEGTFGFRVRP
jgi:methionine-rich copper-binding protein CopC